MNYILATTFVIGVVELVKRIFDRDYRAAVTILAAAVIGGVCGYFGVEGLTVATGIALGIGSSGVVTVAQKI